MLPELFEIEGKKSFYHPLQDDDTVQKIPRHVNIAIMGLVSSGKSTFLNALLGNLWAESSVERTTMKARCYFEDDIEKDITPDDLKKKIEENSVNNDELKNILKEYQDALEIVKATRKTPSLFKAISQIFGHKPEHKLALALNADEKFKIEEQAVHISQFIPRTQWWQNKFCVFDFPGMDDQVEELGDMVQKDFEEVLKFQDLDFVFYLIDSESLLNTKVAMDKLKTVINLLKNQQEKQIKRLNFIIVFNKYDRISTMPEAEKRVEIAEESIIEIFKQNNIQHYQFFKESAINLLIEKKLIQNDRAFLHRVGFDNLTVAFQDYLSNKEMNKFKKKKNIDKLIDAAIKAKSETGKSSGNDDDDDDDDDDDKNNDNDEKEDPRGKLEPFLKSLRDPFPFLDLELKYLYNQFEFKDSNEEEIIKFMKWTKYMLERKEKSTELKDFDVIGSLKDKILKLNAHNNNTIKEKILIHFQLEKVYLSFSKKREWETVVSILVNGLKLNNMFNFSQRCNVKDQEYFVSVFNQFYNPNPQHTHELLKDNNFNQFMKLLDCVQDEHQKITIIQHCLIHYDLLEGDNNNDNIILAFIPISYYFKTEKLKKLFNLDNYEKLMAKKVVLGDFKFRQLLQRYQNLLKETQKEQI